MRSRRGMFGGRTGSVGKCEICNKSRPDDIKQYLANFFGLRVEENDVACYFPPSGGGYDDPPERPADQVREVVQDDFITPEYALEAYGVALNPVGGGYPWALDVGATEKLRAAMRA